MLKSKSAADHKIKNLHAKYNNKVLGHELNLSYMKEVNNIP